MIYYPLSVLMLAGIRDILLISTPADLPLFRRLLGDGSQFGLHLDYAEQPEPKGIAQALVIGAEHIAGDSVMLVLGDNIFHGHAFSDLLAEQVGEVRGCVLFGYSVRDPHRYAVAEVDAGGRLLSIEEKPARPRSNTAVTGLYIYDQTVVDIAKNVPVSPRGLLEITDVNRAYLQQGRAELVDLGRGFAWLDTGTPESLVQATQYVRTLETRQGVRIACLEEVALRMGLLDAEACHRLGAAQAGSGYGRYVMAIAGEHTAQA